MKNSIIVVLCIIFYSDGFYCYGQEIANLTEIFAIQGEIFVSKPHNFFEAEKLTIFHRNVTGLAIHKDYLYLSVKRSDWYRRDSAIWRVKILDYKNFQINAGNWDEFRVLDNWGDDISCMIVAKGYIYSGISDGSVWGCSFDKKSSCEYLHNLKYGISAIDYSPVDDKIYAIKSYPIMPLNLNNNIEVIQRCSPHTEDSCDILWHFQVHGSTAIKVAFGAIWMSAVNVGFLKCLLINGTFPTHSLQCMRFDRVKLSGNIYFGVTEKDVYVHSEQSDYVLRCGGKINDLCYRMNKTTALLGMGPFIIF